MRDEAQARSLSPPAPGRRRRFLLPALAALLIGGIAVIVVLLMWNPFQPASGPARPLDGELLVRITSPDEAKIGLPMQEAGALPVRAGERMAVEVRLSEPGYMYLLWVNTQGQVAPLYPWNNDQIDIKDANAAPPARATAKLVFSPMTIGNGWTFAKHGGLETVLLLARRTRLPDEVKLGEFIGALPPSKMRARDEAVGLRFDRDQAAGSTFLAQNRGNEAEAQESDRSLLEVMGRLRDHFEVIRAVRFAHEGE